MDRPRRTAAGPWPRPPGVRHTLVVLASLLALAVGGAASAQGIGREALVGRDGPGVELPPSVKVGEADLYPELRLGYVHDSNTFLTPSDEVAASGVQVQPSLDLVATRRLLELRATYRGDYASYSESALGYADHELALTADAELSARRRLYGRLRYSREHERLGTDSTRGIAETLSGPLEYSIVDASGSFTYGAEGARGNLELGASLRRISYASLESLTIGDDYTVALPYTIFSLRVSPDTRALLELRYGHYDYDDDLRDRDDLTALVGISLSDRGKSGGSAKIGATRADYATAGRENTTFLVVEAGLFYLPRVYSRFDLRVSRAFDNRAVNTLTDVGDPNAQEVIRDELNLNWRHSWSSRVYSNAYIARASNDRNCPNADDATVSGEAELNLRVRRWLELGAGAGVSERRGALCAEDTAPGDELDYTDVTFGVHVRGTL